MAKEGVQINMYDKVLKENMEASLGSIIQHTTDLHVINSEEIPDDIQHTKERKPDVLKKVTDQHNNTYILHMELQSTNERDMVYRMVEYRVMLQRKYRLPVKQYVLYIGKDKLTMITSITEEDFTFRYKIVSLQDVDYKTYLQKDTPEERILAVLANFGEDNKEEAFLSIVNAVKAVAGGELSQGKYMQQLRILAQLSKLEIKTEISMLLSTITFEMEKDPWYIFGIGNEKKRMVLEMKKHGTDVQFISEVTQVPLEVIQML